MKKLIVVIFMISMFIAGCGITPQTPFIGGFLNDAPKEFTAILDDTLDRMTPVPGTEPFEYTVLEDGKIAGYVNSDGTPGWCSNFTTAVTHSLIDAGYTTDRMKRVYCSIYNTERPDHVVVMVDEKWIFDNRKNYVQKTSDYSKTWGYKTMPFKAPVIFWAKAEGQWIRAKF